MLRFQYPGGSSVRLKSVNRVSLIKSELKLTEYVALQRAIESVGRSLLDRNGIHEVRYGFRIRIHTRSFGSILLAVGHSVLRRVRRLRGLQEGQDHRVAQLLFVLVSSKFLRLRRDESSLPKRFLLNRWPHIGLSNRWISLSSLTQSQEKVLRYRPTFLTALIFQYHYAQR